MAKTSNLVKECIAFISQAPTPYHVVHQIKKICVQQGIILLQEEKKWNLKPGRYAVDRDGSFILFQISSECLLEEGFRIVGSHTDSPCLKIAPQPDKWFEGYLNLSTEIYGGVLLSTWFDRDLSLAGRCHWINNQGKTKSSLFDLKRPVAFLPNLAIHLNRESNTQRTINPHQEMSPLLLRSMDQSLNSEGLAELLRGYLEEQTGESIVRLLSHDICCYDVNPPQIVGWKNDFLVGARFDNLLSVFASLQAFLQVSETENCILIGNDHEEVGSTSHSGAAGPFLEGVLRRLAEDEETFQRMIVKSRILSADNAHAVHPNYVHRHDPTHRPYLGEGPVVKFNANQRYASEDEMAAEFTQICLRHDIPFQRFMNRSDLSCGSTIGPITSVRLGIKALDIGLPTFAMHSIREMAAVSDLSLFVKCLLHFYNNE